MPKVDVMQDLAYRSVATKRKLLFSLRFSFLSVTVLTVLISALSTHIPWVLVSNANVQDMANQISEEIVKGVRREVVDMFASANSDQRVIADLFASKTVLITDVSKRESLFLSYIKANRFYSFVAVGMDNGDFYGAQRKDESHILTIDSAYDATTKLAQRVERSYVGVGQDYSVFGESTKENDYSSTARSWYQLAKSNPQTDVLTEPYIFANTGQPGVNTARTLEIDGKSIGVVNIAIELGRLSLYMQDLKIGMTGTAFLVSPTGELLAFKERQDVKPLDSEDRLNAVKSKTIPKLAESQHPLLKIANAAIFSESVKLTDIGFVRHLYFDGSDEAKDGYFVTLAPTGNNGWIVGTVVPRRDFTAQIEENLRRIWLFVALVIILACAIAAWVSQKLFVNPLRIIIGQTQMVRRFELDTIKNVDTNIAEIHSLSTSVNQMSQGLENFGKFIPLDLVKTLLAQGVRADISGENRTLTIFFMDMVGFTTISEEMGPKLVPYLGKYLSCMSNVIVKHNGTIDKYIGDAVMAFWGAPLYNEDHAVTCCRAAVDCLAELEVLRAEWPVKFRDGLGIRIGLNTGRVIVGNIGSSTRLNYTVLGDPVNLAARLESAGKDYGVSCMIGHSTYELARYDIVARKLDVLRVKGKTESVPVYELLAMADSPASEDYSWIKVFEEGVALFLSSEPARARACFERTIEMRGADLPSEKFIQRCDAILPVSV
jgi:adenylate cyclase